MSLGFVGTEMEAALSYGSGYLPINLTMSEFAPQSNQVARVPTIGIRLTNSLPSLEYRYPPPIAFSTTYTDLLEICRNKIKLVIKQERSLLGLVNERVHKRSRLTLKVIENYHGSIRLQNM